MTHRQTDRQTDRYKHSEAHFPVSNVPSTIVHSVDVDRGVEQHGDAVRMLGLACNQQRCVAVLQREKERRGNERKKRGKS